VESGVSRYEDIDNAIWSDPDFEALSTHATLLYLWSWTNPRCGMAGVYKVSVRTMAESKVPEDAIPAALDELSQARFAFYEDSILWIRSRAKHLRSKGPKMAISVVNDLLKVSPKHPLRARFIAEYGSAPWLRDELKRTYEEPMESLSERPIGKADSDSPSGTLGRVPRTGTGTVVNGVDVVEEQLPLGFPVDLRAHLDAAFPVLSDLAVRQNAKAVSRRSLANVMMGRPRKPFVRAAHDFVAWADGKAQRRQDVLAGYRNWLDRTDDLAATEQLGDDSRTVSLSPAEERRQRRERRVAAMESMIENGGAA
jgi:hypothetical protein